MKMNTVSDRLLSFLSMMLVVGWVPTAGGRVAHRSIVSQPFPGSTGGFVAAWGGNESQQLGITGCCIAGPVPVFGRALAIAGGLETTVAVRPDRSVWEWGRTDTGKPCKESSAGSGVPLCPAQQVPDLGNVVAVADAVRRWASGEYRWALKSDGTVWSWNGPGPVQQVIGLRDVIQIQGRTGSLDRGAFGQMLALKRDGTVWEWTVDIRSGIVPRPVTGLGSITSVAAGTDHALALDGDGRVWSWRYPGNQPGRTRMPQPILVPGPDGTDSLKHITAIAAGYHFSLAVDDHGSVWTWGANEHGQLGIGIGGPSTETSVMIPVHVPGLSGIVAVAAGYRHSLALTSKGDVWGWGGNQYGEVGSRFAARSQKVACKCIATPVRVPSIVDAIAVTAGPRTSFALTRAPVLLKPLPRLSACTRSTGRPVIHRDQSWSISLGSQPMAIAEGGDKSLAFVLTTNSGLRAARGDYRCTAGVTTIDLRTGNVLRTVPVAVWPRSITVAERQNRVVVIGNDDRDRWHGSVSLLDAASGRLLKTTSLDAVVGDGAVAQQAGRIFVPTIQGSRSGAAAVQILDVTSGALLGSLPLPATSIAVHERLNRVYVASGSEIVALDAFTGMILGRQSFAKDWQEARVCGNPRLAVSQRDQRLYALSVYGLCVMDARTLRLVTFINEGNDTFEVRAVDERAGVLVVLSEPNIKYASTSLVLLDSRTGKFIATVDVSAILRSCPEGCSYGAEGMAVAVDEQTGNIFFTLPPSIVVASPPSWRIVRQVRKPRNDAFVYGLFVAQHARRLVALTGSSLNVSCADAHCR